MTKSRRQKVQIVATEYMYTAMRKKVVGTTYRFRRRLHQSLSEVGTVPGKTRNKLAVLAGQEDLLIPCLVDLCVKRSEGKTVMRRYFSPPPSLRLHEQSLDVRELWDDLLLDVDPEWLAQRLFTESDSPAINHIVIPKRPRTSPIDPTHGMPSNSALVDPLLLSPGSRTPVSVEAFRWNYSCSCRAEDLLQQELKTLFVVRDLKDIIPLAISQRRPDPWFCLCYLCYRYNGC